MLFKIDLGFFEYILWVSYLHPLPSNLNIKKAIYAERYTCRPSKVKR